MAKLTSALTLVIWLTSLGALQAQETAKPLGKWERKIGKSPATLIVEETRLHLTILGAKPCAVHADYSMTKDGVIYGLITSVECGDEDSEDDAKLILDAPFSCRYRIDEGALIVRDLKCQEMGSKDDMWNGRFKAVAPTATRAVVPPAYLGTTSGRAYYSPEPTTSGSSSSTSKNEPIAPLFGGFGSGLSR